MSSIPERRNLPPILTNYLEPSAAKTTVLGGFHRHKERTRRITEAQAMERGKQLLAKRGVKA